MLFPRRPIGLICGEAAADETTALSHNSNQQNDLQLLKRCKRMTDVGPREEVQYIKRQGRILLMGRRWRLIWNALYIAAPWMDKTSSTRCWMTVKKKRNENLEFYP